MYLCKVNKTNTQKLDDMKKFVVTKKFDGCFGELYPEGTVLKAEYEGNGFLRFGKMRQKCSMLTGTENFYRHTKPIEAKKKS